MAVAFLADSSALWRIERDSQIEELWADSVDTGEVGSCAGQRTEFRASARNRRELDEFDLLFRELYPDVRHPKTMWRWIEAAQHTLADAGALRALSTVDLMICATAAHHGLTIVHDDNDFDTAARYLNDIDVVRVSDGPNET